VKRALALLLFAAAAGCGNDVVTPDAPPPPADTRDGRWIQDVDYMTSQLARLHPNLFFATPRSEFEAAAQQLKDQVPRLQDHEIVVGLMRVAALPGDSHTTVHRWSGFHRLPVRLERLADGFYVVAAEEALREALGARLVAVGEVAAEALEAGAARLVSHDNEAWLRNQVPDLLAITEVLHVLGATPSPAGARVWLQQPAGALFALDLEARASLPALLHVTTAAGFPPPLHQQRRGENYWMTALPGSRVIYLQYNRCQNGSEPFSAFAGRLFSLLDEGRADRLVVDVRHNGGGNSDVDDPLVNGLQGRPAWRARGRVLCLIDSGTFSSAVWTAADLMRLGAVLVGAPTGGKPNSYGNVQTLVLPNSRLQVGYSTRYFRIVEGSDPASLVPEVAVEPTIEDVRTGRDVLLEAALRFTP
jgi:hypothetical protein